MKLDYNNNLPNIYRALLHIADDYQCYTLLDNFSAFQLKILKIHIRKPDKSLEQQVLMFQKSRQINKNDKSKKE